MLQSTPITRSTDIVAPDVEVHVDIFDKSFGRSDTQPISHISHYYSTAANILKVEFFYLHTRSECRLHIASLIRTIEISLAIGSIKALPLKGPC